MLAYTAVHCTVDELRERISYDELMSGGWFLLELRKAEKGDKSAFRPNPVDIAKFYRDHPEQLL